MIKIDCALQHIQVPQPLSLTLTDYTAMGRFVRCKHIEYSQQVFSTYYTLYNIYIYIYTRYQ